MFLSSPTALLKMVASAVCLHASSVQHRSCPRSEPSPPSKVPLSHLEMNAALQSSVSSQDIVYPNSLIPSIHYTRDMMFTDRAKSPPCIGQLLPFIRLHVPLRHIGSLQFVPEFLGCFRIQLLIAHEFPHLRPLPRELVPLLLEFFKFKVYVEAVGIFHYLRLDRNTFLIQGVNSFKVDE